MNKLLLFQLYRTWSNPMTISLLVLVPLLLILVLGAGFYNSFTPAYGPGVIRIAWLPGTDILHNGFEVMLTQVPQELMTATRVYFRSDGLALLDNGSVDCFVEIQGETDILVYRDPSCAMHAARLESILESFLDYFKLNSIAGRTGFSLDYYPSADNAIDLEEVSPDGFARSREFFAIILLAATLLAGGLVFSSVFCRERKQHTMVRILDCGYSRLRIWLSWSAGNLVSVFVQLLLLYVVSRYILQVRFGEGNIHVFLALASESIFVLALGTTMFTLVRNRTAAWLVLIAVSAVVLLGAVASFLFPANSSLRAARFFSPLWWILQSLEETIFVTGTGFFGTALLVCFSTGIVLFALSALIFARRRNP
ncbi:MAG: ABC transporter permease [Spirochaetales bacterium]|nr:ABC transporter permease [Spirochaetales bacterium]